MKKILIIFGGPSFEHNISIKSAKTILENIDTKKYQVTTVGIDLESSWYIYNDEINNLDENWKNKNIKPIDNIIEFLRTFDKVFPIIHGKNGEDGNIQGMLNLFNIPYVGTDLLGQIIGYDKELTKIICSKYNIPQLPYQVISINDKIKNIEIPFPVIVKPAKCGSSIGINIANNQKELNNHLKTAFKYDNKVIIEKFIKAREFECAVLEDKKRRVSTVGEIKPSNEFYDYDSKYIKESNLMIPANISSDLLKDIQNYSLKIFDILNLSNLSRIDFLYDYNKQELYFNEVNTIPGFTKISMYPLLFNYEGISTKELISKLIEY